MFGLLSIKMKHFRHIKRDNKIKRSIRFFLFVTIVLQFSGCQYEGKGGQKGTQELASPNNLSAHLTFLASDHLGGRDTGTPEFEIAAQYMASQFQQLGLTPAGDNGSWFQNVPLIRSKVVFNSPKFILYDKNNNQILKLNYPDEFIVRGNPISSNNIIRAPIVFAGYGIVAPSFNHNDYDGLDVTGKIVAVLNGRPKFFPSEEGAHLAASKLDFAAKLGAVGMIVLSTPDNDRYESAKTRAYKQSYDRYNRMDKNGFVAHDPPYSPANPNIKGEALLSIESSRELFAAAGKNVQKVFDEINAGNIPAGFELNSQIQLSYKSLHENLSSPNIIAKLRGSDNRLAHESVVFSAHLDHVSPVIKNGVNLIRNGAIDNALGNAMMIEVARLFSIKKASRRSIIFISTTAEEKGLLGSSYFANHPTDSAGQIIANVNLDNSVLLYPFADVVAFGVEHSTIKKHVTGSVEMFDLTLSPDPVPEMAIFVRSDHYSFVKQGIPSVFLWPGFKSRDPELSGEKIFKKYFENDYHQPTDNIDLPINFDSAALLSNISYQVSKEIANDNDTPNWNSGDYFGDIFSKNK